MKKKRENRVPTWLLSLHVNLLIKSYGGKVLLEM